MDNIGNHLPKIPSKGDLQKSEPRYSAVSMERKAMDALTLAERLLSSYPDYGKAPKPYLVSITEILATLDPDVQMALADIKTGIRARCSFLPTIADIAKFADEHTAKRNQFKPIEARDVFIPDRTKPLIPPVYHERMSMPHIAKGMPWGVKPEGYWTAWTPDRRKAYDDAETAMAQ